jgi:hypothetical protein
MLVLPIWTKAFSMRVHATPDDLTEMHIRHMITDYSSAMVMAWMDGF